MSRPPRRLENPPSPYDATTVEWLGEAPPVEVEVYEDDARTILSENSSPDIPFRWSVNPYRGCVHACAYCYARQGHERLGFGAGTDFDTRLLVKRAAPRLLEEAFERRSWRGEQIAFSGMTDCYQPIEASFGLTRACLEVCLRYRNPASVVTKSALVERDADVLAALAREAGCSVNLSVPFFSEDRARAIEPYAPAPARRFKAMARLAAAGVPVGVIVAPLIPGLNDDEIPRILAAAREAGARYATCLLLRLPGSVAQVFEARLRRAFPDRAERVLSALRACRDGDLTDPRFGHRMQGEGARWRAIEDLFHLTARRLGFEPRRPPPKATTFRRPGRGLQRTLFD